MKMKLMAKKTKAKYMYTDINQIHGHVESTITVRWRIVRHGIVGQMMIKCGDTRLRCTRLLK